jgi:hypothetical protein
MDNTGGNREKLSLGLTAAAAYLSVAGVLGLVVPLPGLLQQFAELGRHARLAEAGRYAREFAFGAAYLVSGVGIWRRRAWARNLALATLVIEVPYLAVPFAWGWANGPPSRPVLVGSFLATTAWNALWFFIIYHGVRKRGGTE